MVCTTHGSIMFDARSSAIVRSFQSHGLQATSDARSDPTSSRCQISRDRARLWSFTTVAELFSTDELKTPRPTREWWSQTGSNRRPPACKAGALPTELWPRQGSVVSNQGSDRASTSDYRHLTTDAWNWWAWEDLNFRPHAYQARALTN